MELVKPNQLEGHIIDRLMTIIIPKESPYSQPILVESTSKPNQDLNELVKHQVRDALT